ncbi:MAG: alpha-galactosidase [Christensenellaceae bacterium]|jgi:alpha-galactosidase|nr:alpha-galactosidase [Christensenellaceae bacterium]
MFENGRYKLVYALKDGTERIAESGKDSGSEVKITPEFSEGYFKLKLFTTVPITVRSVSYTIDYSYGGAHTAFFANGYQSWTDTREFKRYDKMHDLGHSGKISLKFQKWGKCGKLIAKIAKLFGVYIDLSTIGEVFTNAGDYNIARYSGKKGEFHGLSYAYLREGLNVQLFGSLNERNGYTVIYSDLNNDTISLEKDLAGIIIDGSYDLFEMYDTQGSYDEVFDAYFAALGVHPPKADPIRGYTTWYNYYPNINEKIVFDDLEALSGKPIEVFQIDDGYQTAVGDWLSIDAKKFPNGMKVIADKIHEKGWKAGIWLAPLAAELKSDLYKNHPDWLIQQDGKPKSIGPNWSLFAGLNFYLPEVREYIKYFFDVVLNEWGYDLVKLDFLYAASAVPLNGKTRAGNMYDAIEFIRECVGDKYILGCGVPIFPCFNNVEYMRIGADMGMSWGHYPKFTHREDVNTIHAIHNGLMRRHLNGRVFHNDPDVFLLRDYNIGHSWEQRKLLAELIKIGGGVLFMSDNVARYNEEQKEFLEYMLTPANIKTHSVNLDHDVYTIIYFYNGEKKTLTFNTLNGKII